MTEIKSVRITDIGHVKIEFSDTPGESYFMTAFIQGEVYDKMIGLELTKPAPPEIPKPDDIHAFLCLAHENIATGCRHKRLDFENDEIACKVKDCKCCPAQCIKMGYVYDALKCAYLGRPK